MTNVNSIKDNVMEPLTSAVLHVLLALVDSPQHGYGVMQSVAETATSEPPMGPSTVYGSLSRMVDAGLVRVNRASGRRSKRYALTPAGHRALWAESARICSLADLVRERRLVND